MWHVGSFVAVYGILCCSAQALRCGARASLVVAHGLQSTWALQLRNAGSVVVARRLSCPAACVILVPQPGIKPESPALEVRVTLLTTGPPGKSLLIFSSNHLLTLSLWLISLLWYLIREGSLHYFKLESILKNVYGSNS